MKGAMVREMKDVPIHERPLVRVSALGESTPAPVQQQQTATGRKPRAGYAPPPREWDAIVCHRAGDSLEFLAECLTSIQKQTVAPKATIVATCAQGKERDELREIAKERGAEVVSNPDWRCQGEKVNAAATKTEAPFFIVLDDDDTFPPDYAEKLFEAWRPECAVVSPQLAKRIGEASGEMVFPLPIKAGHRLGDFSADWIRQEIAKENLFPHPCLQLRAAHELVGGYPENPEAVQDWSKWKRYANAGWQFALSEAWFNYRRHDRSMTVTTDMTARRVEAIADTHRVAIFTPFAGRAGSIRRWQRVIAECGWPAERLQLIAIDDSWVAEGDAVDPDKRFGAQLRRAITELRVSAQTYCRITEPPPNGDTAEELAGGDQHDRQRRIVAVANRVAGHFERARQICGADWLVTLEDDLEPPPGWVRMLLDGITPGVAMVGAPYLSRYEQRGYLVWAVESRAPYRATPVDPPWPMGTEGEGFDGEEIREVDGTGTGCALIRREALRFCTFRGFLDPHNSRWGGQDIGLCWDLRQHGYVVRVHWGCVAKHYHDGAEYMRETSSE